jgi:hypothetical protein
MRKASSVCVCVRVKYCKKLQFGNLSVLSMMVDENMRCAML